MALPNIFYPFKLVGQIIGVAFWWVLLMLIVLFVPFLRVWWWVFFPLVLSIEVRTLYKWWINWDYNYANRKWVMLELITPKEVLTPLKAMEDVYTIMWSVLCEFPPSWREEWCEGALHDAPGWMSWEIASIEGNLHFYVRVSSSARPSLETALYSHYPELEIREVSDYARNVPQNIPNEEWDTYGEDFILGRKPEVYPIRTYEKFFEPQGEKISAEEKRIDPIASLLEQLSKLGPGEQYWLQFITMSGDESEFMAEAKQEIAKLSKRPVKKKLTTGQLIMEMLWNLIMGPKKEGSGEKASYKWISSAKTEGGEDELLLSPGEREILTEVENKIKRPIFRTNIRGVYVAKRANWQSGNKTLARTYFSHFGANNLNFIKFSKVTRPKSQWMYRKSIVAFRSRKQFRNYVNRFTPLFPDRKKEMALLNTEEMATIYHFPLKITGLVAPTMARVESKKGGPPPNLPTE